jgi:hypothetical protein
LYAIAHENFDSVQTHLPGEVREDEGVVFELYAKKSVGKRLFDDSNNTFGF